MIRGHQGSWCLRDFEVLLQEVTSTFCHTHDFSLLCYCMHTHSRLREAVACKNRWLFAVASNVEVQCYKVQFRYLKYKCQLTFAALVLCELSQRWCWVNRRVWINASCKQCNASNIKALNFIQHMLTQLSRQTQKCWTSLNIWSNQRKYYILHAIINLKGMLGN